MDVGDVAEGHGRARGEVAPDFGVELRDVRVDGGNVVTIARVDGGKILDKIGVCVNDLERIVRNAAKKCGQENAICWTGVGGESASIDAVEELIFPPELGIVVLGRGSFRWVDRLIRYRLKAGVGRGPWAIGHRSKLGISKEPNKEGTAGRVDQYDAKETPFVMLRTTTALSRVYAPDVFAVLSGGEAPKAGGATMATERPAITIKQVCRKLGGAKNRMSQTPAWSTTQNVPWGGKYWDDEEDLSLPDWFYEWETGALFVGYLMGDGSAADGNKLTIRATDLDEVLLLAETFLTIFQCEGMHVFVHLVGTDQTVGVDLDRWPPRATTLTCRSRLARSPGS